MEKPEQKLLLYKLSDRLFAAIQKNLQLERRQALLVKLGIDTVLNVIPKLIITIILALLLHELVPVLVLWVVFSFAWLCLWTSLEIRFVMYDINYLCVCGCAVCDWNWYF